MTAAPGGKKFDALLSKYSVICLSELFLISETVLTRDVMDIKFRIYMDYKQIIRNFIRKIFHVAGVPRVHDNYITVYTIN